MNESTLKKVRNEYIRIKNEKETLISYKNELNELINDEKVKRFMELSEIVDKDYIVPSEETIVTIAYNGVPEAFGEQNINSNNIMVYMGSYINSASGNPDNDYITYETDPNTSYKSYMDLETTEVYNVLKDECLEFENEHITLYLPVSEYTEAKYYRNYIKLQKWFKIQLIHRSQADVIKEMQESYEYKHKNLHPYFYEVGKIMDLPIDEYIKNHPEDGFVETFCLSEKEYKRIKLYRKQLKKEL